MKFVLFFVFFFSVSFSFATILTVDNRIPSGGQYTTFDVAYTSAADGDSIYLFPSPLAYTPVTIYKRLHIFGGGFEYAFESSGVCRTEFNSNIVFSTGSASSSISGIKINGYLCLNESNIEINNCFITVYVTVTGNNITINQSKIFSIKIDGGYGDILINKCYVYGDNSFSTNTKIGIYMLGNNSVTISNCIIENNWNGSSYPNHAIHIASSASDVFLLSNYIGANNPSGSEWALFTNSQIVATNNIFYDDISSSMSMDYFTYNMFSSNITGLSTTNQTSVNVPSLFVDWVNKDFHLAPSSLAIGAGEDGIDCGPYGGASPFNDNYNISPLPSIIELHGPTVVVPAEGTMPVEIRATTSGN